jgi:hypothetical protein
VNFEGRIGESVIRRSMARLGAVYQFEIRPFGVASHNLLLYDVQMGTERTASPALEAFIDKSIDLAKERGYNPTIFIGMRHQYGTIDAIERLVQSGDIQSGFKRLNQLNLAKWTIESAVIEFPAEFSRNARECAEWRLQQVKSDST